MVEMGFKKRLWWLWLSAALLVISFGPPDAPSPGEFLVAWTAGAARLMVTIAIVALFFRNNPAAYVGAAFCSTVVPALILLLGQPAGFYVWNGVLLGALALAGLAWLLWGGKNATEDVSTVAVAPS